MLKTGAQINESEQTKNAVNQYNEELVRWKDKQ